MKKLTSLQLDQQYEAEATLLAKAKQWLDAQPDVLCLRICDKYHKGYSDLFLCVNGIFVAAELKDNIGKPSAHQIKFIQKVRQYGGIGKEDVRTLGEIVDMVEEARMRCKTLTK